MSHTYNLYINSKNRGSLETPHDFNINLTNQIMVRDDQYLNVDVCSFYMINSMYNVSSVIGNNTFDIEIRNIENNNIISNIYKTIPDGNYSVITLRDVLNKMLKDIISISYNYAQNTYTYTKIDENFKYIFKNIKCKKLLGLFNETVEITTNGITSQYLNMVDYQQVIIKTDLEYMSLNQDNITDTDENLNVSQILLFVNKQDVEPFKCIKYQNEDAGDAFSYNLNNQNITRINFKVFNENNMLITDCPDWLMHLKFTVSDRNKMTLYDNFKKIIQLLSDIHYVLLSMLFKNNNLSN